MLLGRKLREVERKERELVLALFWLPKWSRGEPLSRSAKPEPGRVARDVMALLFFDSFTIFVYGMDTLHHYSPAYVTTK